MLLVLNILLHSLERRSTHCRYKVAVCPQGREFPFQERELLTQEPRGTPFDEPYQPVNAKWRVTLNQQMHVIEHDL
jgi:hypothetical protein